jgi:hypothetical protein
MIYTVECSFDDPASEAQWNEFYSAEKLPALISVAGFRTSRRFKSLSDGCPVYLAIHTVDGLDVLTGEEYRQKGGGNFARWQQHIINWRRNLYDGIELAPAVQADEVLVMCANGPDALTGIGLAPLSMSAVALDKSPQRRWLASMPRRNAHLVERISTSVQLYTPMTGQLTSERLARAASNTHVHN